MFEIAIRNGTDIRGNQFTRRLNPRQDKRSRDKRHDDDDNSGDTRRGLQCSKRRCLLGKDIELLIRGCAGRRFFEGKAESWHDDESMPAGVGAVSSSSYGASRWERHPCISLPFVNRYSSLCYGHLQRHATVTCHGESWKGKRNQIIGSPTIWLLWSG